MIGSNDGRLAAEVARRLREGDWPDEVGYIEEAEWERLSPQERARRCVRGHLVVVVRLPERIT